MNRSKNQIKAEMKLKSEDFKKRMAFIKDEFWPALCEASESVEDAGILLTGFNNQIMESFLGLMKERTIADLELETHLDTKSPKYAENMKLLNLFADHTVFDAKAQLEGMKGEIETFKHDEMSERPLSSLKPKWIDAVISERLK